MRKYKFKVGYGGLISRKITAIDKKKLSNDEIITACSVVRYSKTFREICLSCDKIKNLDLRFQVCRSFSALEFWEKSPGRKIGNFRDIIIKNLLWGSSYTKKIKDIFAYGMRNYYSLGEKGYVEIHGERHLVDNYNYTPPLQYLILFHEEFDDMTECFNIPSKEIKEDVKKEIKKILQELLPDELEFVRPESLFMIKTTGVSDFLLMPSKHYKESSKSRVTFTKKFRARRERIQISPQNNRDIGICDLPTYYTVRLLDEYFLQILEGIESSALGSKDIYAKINSHHNLKNRRGTSFYYMRDYKKSALTMSHKLVKVIQDILLEKYGEDSPFQYLSMYLDQEIKDKDKILRPKRGFPLGMGNHLYTLVNIIAGQMLRNRSPVCLEYTFLAGNDDSSLHVRIDEDEMSVPEAADHVLQEDISLHEELDMILQVKKCFWGWDSVFFEEYSHPNFANKEGLFFAGIGALRLCETIAEAKEHSSNILTFCKFDVTELIDHITSWFGWEFFPAEVRLDYSLGGWCYSKNKNGLDIILKCEEEHLYDLSRAIRASREYHPIYREERFQTSTGKVAERFGIRPLKMSYDEDDVLRDFLMPDSLIRNRGERITKHTKDLSNTYRRIQSKRAKCAGHTNRHNLFLYYFESYDCHDIPEECVEEYTYLYDCAVVCNSLSNSLNVSDALGQFLFQRALEGDISLNDDFRDISYISKYNSKYLAKELRSKKLKLESSEIDRIFTKRETVRGVTLITDEKEKILSEVIYEPYGEYEIPFGLEELANNPIIRYVREKFRIPVKYKKLYRDIICTAKSVRSRNLTVAECNQVEELEKEFPDFDIKIMIQSVNKIEIIPYICRALKGLEDKRASATTEEVEKSKLYICGRHASGHNITWKDEGLYPTPNTDSNCYLCNMLSTWLESALQTSGDPSKETTTLSELKSVYQQILGPDFDEGPDWFEPAQGWALYTLPPEEIREEGSEDLSDIDQDDEQYVEDEELGDYDEVVEYEDDEDGYFDEL
jgi:hypothetical protein